MLRNKTGYSNTAIGFKSLTLNTTGATNAAFGHHALGQNTTGYENTGIGQAALIANINGYRNTALGYRADVTADGLTNARALGYIAKVNASNKVRIGNSAVSVIEGQVPFTTPSNGRFKFNVPEDVQGLAFILRLRPVTYQFDVKKFDLHSGFPDRYMEVISHSPQKIRRIGFIAQEVEKAAKESMFTFSGIITPRKTTDHYSLSYESFIMPLVKSIQEQQVMIDKQAVIIREFEIALNSERNERMVMKEEINALKNILQKLLDEASTTGNRK
jgi:hypothetical protein